MRKEFVIIYNMKKIIVRVIFVIGLLVAANSQSAAVSSFVAVPQEDKQAVKAYLFLSDGCPWCRKLKQEGFSAKFSKKYAGQVVLEEYEVHTPQGRQQFARMRKKHNLDGGVPVLIVGEQVFVGYSENLLSRAGKALQKERQKAPAVKKVSKKKEQELPPVVGIIVMDDLKGIAPAKDIEQMKQYLEKVQDENGETLASVNSIFSAKVGNQAMAIINTNEQKLKDIAAKSPTYEDFVTSAKDIMLKQQTQLNALMSKNAKAVR